MTDLTTYLENEVQVWWSQGVTFDPAPSNVYLALHTQDPTNDATVGEVSATDYARLETSPSDWTVSGSGPTNVTNAVELKFPSAKNSWGDISHISVWDALTGGNALWKGSLASTKTIATDDRFVLQAGDFNANLD